MYEILKENIQKKKKITGIYFPEIAKIYNRKENSLVFEDDENNTNEKYWWKSFADTKEYVSLRVEEVSN